MRSLTTAISFLVVVTFVGCSDQKPRDFFAPSGITIGDPSALGVGAYKIPIEFETAIVHSGQWIDSVNAKVAGSDILITASFNSTNRKSNYPGYIEVKGASPGTYTLIYHDPDGTDHAIGSVTLP